MASIRISVFRHNISDIVVVVVSPSSKVRSNSNICRVQLVKDLSVVIYIFLLLGHAPLSIEQLSICKFNSPAVTAARLKTLIF